MKVILANTIFYFILFFVVVQGLSITFLETQIHKKKTLTRMYLSIHTVFRKMEEEPEANPGSNPLTSPQTTMIGPALIKPAENNFHLLEPRPALQTVHFPQKRQCTRGNS